MKDWLEWTRRTAKQLVEQFVPAEANLFDDIWPKLRREVEQWRGQVPTDKGIRRYRKRAASVLGPGIRVRGKGLVTPWVVGVLVASVLEMAGSSSRGSEDVQRVLRKYGKRFGLSLQGSDEQEKVAYALADLVEVEVGRFGEVRVSGPPVETKTFRIFAEEYDEPLLLDAGELKDWRRGAGRKERTVFIDETQGLFTVENEPVKVPPISRRALRVLLDHGGEATGYDVLYEEVKEERLHRSGYERSSIHRWLSDLRSGHEKLDDWVATTEGYGYRWSGPSSFCVIEVVKKATEEI